MVSNVGSIEVKNKHLDPLQMNDGANYAMKTDHSTRMAGQRAVPPLKTYSDRCDQSYRHGQRNIHSCGDCWARTLPRDYGNEEAYWRQGGGSSSQNRKRSGGYLEQTGGSLDDRAARCQDRQASKLFCT
jgi:hypothetical protein